MQGQTQKKPALVLKKSTILHLQDAAFSSAAKCGACSADSGFTTCCNKSK